MEWFDLHNYTLYTRVSGVPNFIDFQPNCGGNGGEVGCRMVSNAGMAKFYRWLFSVTSRTTCHYRIAIRGSGLMCGISCNLKERNGKVGNGNMVY